MPYNLAVGYKEGNLKLCLNHLARGGENHRRRQSKEPKNRRWKKTKQTKGSPISIFSGTSAYYFLLSL